MATIFSATEPDEGSDEQPPGAVDLDKIERGVRLILEGVGEDTERAGLQRTPRRVAEMYAELTAGMQVRLDLIDVNDATGQFAPPSDAERQAFRDALTAELGMPVVRRYSGGKDVEGACGMLAGRRSGEAD